MTGLLVTGRCCDSFSACPLLRTEGRSTLPPTCVRCPCAAPCSLSEPRGDATRPGEKNLGVSPFFRSGEPGLRENGSMPSPRTLGNRTSSRSGERGVVGLVGFDCPGELGRFVVLPMPVRARRTDMVRGHGFFCYASLALGGNGQLFYFFCLFSILFSRHEEPCAWAILPHFLF